MQPQPEIDSSNDNSSDDRPLSYVDIPTPISTRGGFPVLIDYSAMLEPVPTDVSRTPTLVVQYAASDSIRAFKERIQYDIYRMGTKVFHVQTIAEQRVEHMSLGILWEGQGQNQGLSLILDERNFDISMKLMSMRNLRDRVVALFNPRDVPIPATGSLTSKGKGKEVVTGEKPSSQEPYLAGQLTKYKDDVLMHEK